MSLYLQLLLWSRMHSMIPGICGIIAGFIYRCDLGGIQEIGVWILFLLMGRSKVSGNYSLKFYRCLLLKKEWIFCDTRLLLVRILLICVSIIVPRNSHDIGVCSFRQAPSGEWHGECHLSFQEFLQRWLQEWTTTEHRSLLMNPLTGLKRWVALATFTSVCLHWVDHVLSFIKWIAWFFTHACQVMPFWNRANGTVISWLVGATTCLWKFAEQILQF